ncbi:hypothetical protein ACFQJ5_02090 [Halomicroarcula sp. GCM10025324]|uniref:hypothetical protein n=1 Tax=Haloarcula TaxID=2237 RepID=UPI0023E8D96B|nr:hypothetical protein [Halomicroarcula sp. ZS-22-S1]
MPDLPPHCRLEASLPDAAGDYFAPERESLAQYLDLVPDSLDPSEGDAAVGPVFSLPWIYVADLTGWRGSSLARLLAADAGCPCYQLSTSARDSVPTLWAILDESAAGPVVLHVQLRGDTGPVPPTLREAVNRGFERPGTEDEEAISGEPANVLVVFTDTSPSKRLDAPLPDSTTPLTGAVLSYAPRRGMLPELPDGTTYLDDPPAIHDREDALETLLEQALADVGSPADRAAFVSAAVETLSITHSLVGKRDLLFDVSPRAALKYGRLLDEIEPSKAIRHLQTDVVQQVPQTPGSEDLRTTLRDLFPS